MKLSEQNIPLIKTKGRYRKDYSNIKFGNLLVLKMIENSNKCLCICDCGVLKEIHTSNLVNGYTKTCGCSKRNISYTKTHGLTKTKEYRTWKGIKNRCYNKNIKDYTNYGLRGISMCESWKSSFENFLSDMGKAPTPNHSIDRIDNNGNYEPSNCKWSTKIEQNNNKRTNTLIQTDWGIMTINQLSRKTGINRNTISKKIKKGLTINEILN